jgi:glycosyltransferase involved in cell wall biosynthesis
VEAGLEFSVRRQSRIPESPPVVLPLAPCAHRPQWSVMIPVYNCSGYLRQNLLAVLSQDPGEDCMQIEVVDDGSTDADVEAIVSETGKGRVGYFRQPENVGSLWNFHTCLQRSRGHLVHILHGDDVVREGFYQNMEALFKRYPSIGAGFCRYAYIDETGRTLFLQEAETDRPGIPDNWLARLCERQRIQYVAMVVRRKVYEQLGGFYGVEYGEDWEMWVRIAARYEMGYTPQVLAEYRKHHASISGKSFVTAENMASLAWVMNKIQHYLPAHRRDTILQASKNFYAHYGLRVANTLWKRFKDREGASAQALAAWNMSRDAGLLYKIIKLYTRITLNI